MLASHECIVLGDDPSFRSIAGTAEQTGLANRHVALITVGQALHWFDLTAAQVDFTREARELLDTAAGQRGRSRLVLGVRVPQTVEECRHLGFDVARWTRDKLVDWVVPSDFRNMDFNIRTEGTDCRIYPAIHPAVCRGVDAKGVRMMSAANYRAAAQNFYAFGAHGISPYNYQWHWGEPRGTGRLTPGYMWPGALGYLRELREPGQVSQRDRHYLFYPLWARPACSKSPSDFWHDDNIYLHRTGPLRQGSRQFRLAEDLSDPDLRGTLQFKAVGLNPPEALEIQLNGSRVPDEYVTRLPNSWGRDKSEGGRVLDVFYLYVLDLNWWGAQKPPITDGDNKLTVRLIPEEGETEGTVAIDELEVYVYVRK